MPSSWEHRIHRHRDQHVLSEGDVARSGLEMPIKLLQMLIGVAFLILVLCDDCMKKCGLYLA